jgi:hypothetical protein
MLSLFVGFFYLLLAPLPFFPEFEKDCKVFYCRTNPVEKINPEFVNLIFFQNCRSAFVIIPETLSNCQLLVLADLILAVIDVKETSSGRQRGPS